MPQMYIRKAGVEEVETGGSPRLPGQIAKTTWQIPYHLEFLSQKTRWVVPEECQCCLTSGLHKYLHIQQKGKKNPAAYIPFHPSVPRKNVYIPRKLNWILMVEKF